MAPKTGKKLDTAIVAALIGLCGTVIVALLGSPFLINWLNRTPPTPTLPPATATPETATPTDFPLPTATLEPGPTETPLPSPVATATQPQPTPAQAVVVFSEDFEDNTASGFGFSSGQWVLSKDHGDVGLEGQAEGAENPASAVFGPGDFSNGAIEFQVKFDASGAFLLNFRDDGTQTYTLRLSAAEDEMTVGYSSAEGNWSVEPLAGSSSRPFTFEENTRYTVRVEVIGDQILVWVDGNRLMTLTDSRLAQGFLEFGIQSPAVVVLDNVKVWDSGP